MKSKDISWRDYILNGIARRSSQIGEFLHVDRLIYNPLTMQKFHNDAIQNAPIVVPALLNAFPDALLFLDVGCGSGAFSAELLRHGRRAIGLERSPHGRRIGKMQGVDSRPFDLLQTPPALVSEQPNVVFSFEVAEHMPDSLGRSLVKYIASFGVPVVFSAAHPGQGGTGHINERNDEYWIKLFESLGFEKSESQTHMIRSECADGGAAPWFHKNPFVMIPIS